MKLKPHMSPFALSISLATLLTAMMLSLAPSRAQQLDKVSFGTNWVAEAEHGGFFQAVADGTYKRYGLDVTIVPGGPNVNNRILLVAGKLDFAMTANNLLSFDAVANKVPVVSIAAIFQKDPQVFLVHPEIQAKSLDDLKPLTLFISKEGLSGYFQWMKSEHGFTDEKVKPYTFNPQPFLVDRKSAMQGYVTSEPFAVAQQANFTPTVILLADQGFDAYSTLIDTRRELIERKPDLVQRFVDASIVGWYSYLYGDNAAGNALIKKTNPEISDDLLKFSVARMKDAGIVDSGDAVQDGIGAMSDTRFQNFYATMAKAGVAKPDIDYRRGYTLQFVNKGVGLQLRPRR